MADPTIKIRIDTAADVSGARETKAAIDGVTDSAKEAGRAFDGLKQKPIGIEEVMPGFAAMKGRAEKLPGGSGAPPPLPEAPNQRGGLTKGGVFAAQLGAEMALKGMVLLIGGMREFAQQTAEGVQRAADMGRELEGMDEASRQAAVQGMGPLGQLISENSPLLAEFARDSEKVKGKLDEMWTAMGVRLIPALSEGADALASWDSTQLGEELGQLAGGAVVLANETFEVAAAINKASGSTDGWTGGLLGFSPVLKQAAGNVSDFLKTLNDGAEYERAFDPERLAAAEASRLDAVKKAQGELDKYREESTKTTLQKIADLEKRRDEAVNSGNSNAAIDAQKQIDALQKKVSAEEKAAEARQKAQQEAKGEYEVERQLAQAIAEKNTEKQRELLMFRDYQKALKETGDAEFANRIAREQDIKRQDEAKKKAEEAAKVEGERTKREESQKKIRSEQIALQTRLNEALAAGDKVEAEKVRWMQEYLRLQQQGESEEDARRAANASSGARAASAADAAERQLAAEKGITQEQKNRHTSGSVTGAIDQKIDLTRPVTPQTDFQAEFNRPIIPPAAGQPPAQQPSPIPPPISPQPPSSQGQEATSSGADGAAKAAGQAADAAGKLLAANTEAMQEIAQFMTQTVDVLTSHKAEFNNLKQKITNLKAG